MLLITEWIEYDDLLGNKILFGQATGSVTFDASFLATSNEYLISCKISVAGS